MECPDRPAQFQVAAADCADNIEENASNVQTTLHRLNPMLGVRTRAYWSSKGSRDEHSNEWLLLSLVHPPLPGAERCYPAIPGNFSVGTESCGKLGNVDHAKLHAASHYSSHCRA